MQLCTKQKQGPLRKIGRSLFPDFIIASPKLEFQPIIGFDEV